MLTRRSLLAAGAGALGAGTLGRAGAEPSSAMAAGAAQVAPLGRAGGAAGSVYELPLGRLGPGTVAVRLPVMSQLVGVSWSSPRAPAIELRFRAAGGAWSGWARAGGHAHAGDTALAGAPEAGEPLWTGGARELGLRCATAASGVSVHAVSLAAPDAPERTRAGAPRGEAASLALAQPVLQAGPGQPPIIARGEWARGKCPPSRAPEYGAVELAFVHHTDNPNGYGAAEVPAMLRAIYLYHRYVRGWNDIGYNFVVDLYGRIFEARAGGIDEAVVGAQAGGYNVYSTGVAVLGSFSEREISRAAQASLQRLIGWKLALHGTPVLGKVVVHVDPAGAYYSRYPAGARVTLPRVAGHRQADTTECPGDALYGQLGAIRAAAAAQAGEPVRATIALVQVPGATAPLLAQPSTPPGSYLFGTLALLGGEPLAAQQVQIQARSSRRHGEVVEESTLAQLSTNAQGEWALALPPSAAGGRRWLRALFAGGEPGAGAYGAAVSQAVRAALA